MQRAFVLLVFRTSAKCKIRKATERHPSGLVRISHFVKGQNPLATSRLHGFCFGTDYPDKINII